MLFVGSKKLRIALVLSIFLGFVFSFTCTFNHHSKVSAHASTSESIAVLAQDNGACCGTTFSKSEYSPKEAFLTLAKNYARDLYHVLLIGLMLVSAIIWRRFFEHSEQRLAYFVRFYIRQRLEIFSYHYLRLAFSRGILHSKKYNLAFN